MNQDTLQKQIKKRANALVQNKIKQCKVEVYNAINKVLGKSYVYTISNQYLGTVCQSHKDIKKILEILSQDNNTQGWPKEIWQNEEEQITTSILSKMDELQQTLFAKDLDESEIEAFGPDEN